MKPPRLLKIFPHWTNAALAVLAAILLTLAFPDFELWWMAWIALVPLMIAVEREKASIVRSFIAGWIFGTAFFFGTCWWLAYAPIHYAGFPPFVAYSLIFIATIAAGLFPAVFAAIMALVLRRFSTRGYFAAPFVWVFSEFLRYWLTGNNWNAIGYSQYTELTIVKYASIGGVSAVSFAVLYYNLAAAFLALLIVAIITQVRRRSDGRSTPEDAATEKEKPFERPMFALINDYPDEGRSFLLIAGTLVFYVVLVWLLPTHSFGVETAARVIAVQPNVPMSGLDARKLEVLRQRQIDIAETAIRETKEQRSTNNDQPITVILPESPMDFMYNDDREFQHFIGDFARRNNVSVLFNSAEPDKSNGKYFNSAVMVSPEGREIGEYDKIYLLPFGEAVPPFLEGIVPGFVGNFSYGRNYDLLPVGDAQAGVMICFESHFGQLSRHYAANGADVIIEMTNDGYLGPTPVLRQHLANAVFRAVETNRPVLRVTNVGVTAYINERGQVLDPLPVYAEGARTWSVSKSDGSQTLYVRFGDWFAWVCTAITILLLGYILIRKKSADLLPISDS